MSSYILEKFKEPLILLKIYQIDKGAIVEEEITETYFEGAIFDLGGSEYKLILDGFFKIDSKKLFTYKDIIDSKKEKVYHKILYKGLTYSIKQKKIFHADSLKIYYLEVLE